MDLSDRHSNMIFTERGQRLRQNPTNASTLREEFREVGFVQVEDFIRPEPCIDLMHDIFDLLLPLAHELKGHHAVHGDSLGPGGHYKRLDPGFPKTPPDVRTRLYEAFRDTGLLALGAGLGKTLTPLVRFVVQEPVAYERVFLLFYEEGHYISPHNDAQTGDRFNIQFPFPLTAVSALRVLRGGLFRVHYDNPGCMRILGPRVWHEVVPVLRSREGVAPRRVNLTLRFY